MCTCSTTWAWAWERGATASCAGSSKYINEATSGLRAQAGYEGVVLCDFARRRSLCRRKHGQHL